MRIALARASRRASACAAARAPPRRGRRSARAPRRPRAARGRPARSPRRPSPSAGRAPRRSASSGAERRVVRLRARARCASRPVTSPSRRSRAEERAPARSPSSSSASSQPSSAAAHVLLQDAERRVDRAARVRVPAAERARCSRKPRSVRNRSISSSGLIPGLEPAEHLEDQLVVEDDRRVRLLGADRAAPSLHLAAEAGEALERPELDDALPPCSVSAAADRVHELARERRVGERRRAAARRRAAQTSSW